MNKFLVLMYHALNYEGKFDDSEMSSEDRDYSFDGKLFLRQIDDAIKNRIEFCNVEKVFFKNSFTANKIENKSKPQVIITFDDSWKSHTTVAVPELLKRNITPILFLTIDQLDNKNMMAKEDVKKVSEMGAIIGSHGMKHRYFNDLTEKELFVELSESKKILSDLSGQEVTLLSLPGGRSHPALEKIMDETGYKYVFNSCPELWNAQNQQKAIGRVVITKKYNFEKMQKLFNNPSKELKYNLLRFKILNRVKKIIGNKNYDRLRDMFL